MNLRIDPVSPPAAGASALPAGPLRGLADTTAAMSPQPARISAEAARQAARQINDFLRSSASGVEFSVDSGSNKVVVRIVDTQTHQLIRQIPSDEMLAVAQALDQMTGLLLSQKA